MLSTCFRVDRSNMADDLNVQRPIETAWIYIQVTVSHVSGVYVIRVNMMCCVWQKVKFITCVRERQDAGRVSFTRRVQSADPATEVAWDVARVIVPVDGHGHRVRRAHSPQRVHDRLARRTHLTKHNHTHQRRIKIWPQTTFDHFIRIIIDILFVE